MSLGGMGARTPTNRLIHKLRLMADAGGMLTRDRIRVIIEAADRLEEIDERNAIMMEGNSVDVGKVVFDAMNDNSLYGGGADEEH